MAIKPRLSVLGLYMYDSTLFDGWLLPDGVNKSALISLVVEECNAFDTVYPDLDIFKTVLAAWSTRRLPVWNKLYSTTQLEYNPIENYDRHEERTINESATSNATTTDNTDTTDSATGFNSATLQTTGKVETDGTTTSNNSGQRQNLETAHIHGNIGVTSSQQMIEQERNIARFDIYEMILDDFIEKFCVTVY